MNIVDSSAWLEYFADTSYADAIQPIIERTADLLVPSIVLFEVCKKVRLHKGNDAALSVAAHMRLGRIIDIDADLALLASSLSVQHKLPMADSIIFAVAVTHEATVWTFDSDFRGLPNVKFLGKGR